MSRCAVVSAPHYSNLGPFLRGLWRTSPALTITGGLMLGTLAATVVGLIVDERVITDAPAWLKPTKFAISTAIYAFTLVWLLGFVRGHSWLVGLVGNATAAALTIEVAIISLQVVRGTTSHFNETTTLDAALFYVMGGFIILVWLLGLLTAGLLLLQRLPDPVLGWSLRLGILVAVVGMAVAIFMVRPTPAQRAIVSASNGRGITGSHNIGRADGGPGLPLVGWSTVSGDLRVAHFVGLHALQVLPLLAWALSRATRLSSRHRQALIVTAGLLQLGLVLLLTWQALRGQSFVAPDAATLAALAALLVAAGVAASVVAAHGLRRLVGLDARQLSPGEAP
jgi:hypothetical protein